MVQLALLILVCDLLEIIFSNQKNSYKANTKLLVLVYCYCLYLIEHHAKCMHQFKSAFREH